MCKQCSIKLFRPKNLSSLDLYLFTNNNNRKKKTYYLLDFILIVLLYNTIFSSIQTPWYIFSCIKKNINFLIIFFKNDIPKGYLFVNKPLECNLELLNVISELNSLLPQLNDFVYQFNNVINQTGVNVITDTTGNMSIEVPKDMPDSEVNSVSNRIGVIDRLITTRGQEVNDLIQKGLNIENKLKSENPNYVSQLSEKIAEFKKLNESFKH